jgi:hypothetical protein
MFFPGIIQQGSATYLAATGQTQQPFLSRWLLLTAAMFTVSALLYAIRLALAHQPAGTASDLSATERHRVDQHAAPLP